MIGTKIRLVIASAFAVGSLTSAGDACAAESIIRNPGDHPEYKVELEPQLVFGWGHLYAGSGFGAGVRAAIPIVENGFIKTINNNVAISFGFDWLRYSNCFYGGFGCGASYFIFPAAMQWNFWLTPQWSVFGEPGLYVYHGLFGDYCSFGTAGCTYPTRTGVDFAFYAGGRFHFGKTAALTMRIGYPTLSIGVSFLL